MQKLRQSEKENKDVGNMKHFPVKAFIVTPKEMLEIMQKE